MSEEARMKKTIIKIAVCVVVFIASAFIIGGIMNQGHNNMTMEMAPATLPVITMESGGVACNELHGNTVEMDVAYQKDTVTMLGAGRQANFTVDTYGREITGISMEVRSIDGSRLIENGEVTGWKAGGKSFPVTLTLKDLIDTNTQYSLTLILELEGEQKVYYYTTILWNDDLHIAEILEFASDFHGKLYDKEAAKELTKYLEPNSKLTDNGTFHKVNIHSNFQQITWGNLDPAQEGAASLRLVQVNGNIASLLMDFVVSTGEGKNKIYYSVEEYYRVRYTSERMYLLDYERTMTQIPDTGRMYANDKILLGITDENVEECFQMALKWRNLNGCEDDEEKNSEMCVTLNSLRLYKELNLIGGLLRVGDEIVAFTIGEAVNDDTFVVHIEKAYADIEGAYTMINQQFVEHEIAGKYKYTNREDDVGEEGLRKAKLSYKPVFMVEKGVVTLKEDSEKECAKDDI